jgi:hypothetical protein
VPFPNGWPPRRTGQGNGALRFYVEGVATALFEDNAWLFSQPPEGSSLWVPLPVVPPGGGVSTGLAPTVIPPFPGGGQNDLGAPVPMAWSTMIRVVNLGTVEGDLEISFDGTNVHGLVGNANSAANEFVYERCEAGISVRGANGNVAVPFRIEAW